MRAYESYIVFTQTHLKLLHVWMIYLIPETTPMYEHPMGRVWVNGTRWKSF